MSYRRAKIFHCQTHFEDAKFDIFGTLKCQLATERLLGVVGVAKLTLGEADSRKRKMILELTNECDSTIYCSCWLISMSLSFQIFMYKS